MFGTAEIRVNSFASLPQWRRVLAGVAAEREVYRRCAEVAADCPSQAVGAWQALLKGLAGAQPAQQLREVNRFINQWPYKPDQENWGRRDYWATPLEFLRRSGDCEDYAIAKYVSLRALGYPRERLRLVVLQDVLRNLPHAVLAVEVEGETLILDVVSNAVLPDSRLAHYVPYYSLDETSRFAHVTPDLAVAVAARPQGAASTAP
jgi:predicted transglutaminase-like cysteine proteinase